MALSGQMHRDSHSTATSLWSPCPQLTQRLVQACNPKVYRFFFKGLNDQHLLDRLGRFVSRDQRQEPYFFATLKHRQASVAAGCQVGSVKKIYLQTQSIDDPERVLTIFMMVQCNVAEFPHCGAAVASLFWKSTSSGGPSSHSEGTERAHQRASSGKAF